MPFPIVSGNYDVLSIINDIIVIMPHIHTHTPQCTSRGHLDVMLLLLDCGASVNALDHDGLTPLHLAVIHANRDSTKLLLWYGSAVFNASHVTNTLHVVQLAQSVHVCHDLVSNAVGEGV